MCGSMVDIQSATVLLGEGKRKDRKKEELNHTTTVLRPLFRDHPGKPVPIENF